MPPIVVFVIDNTVVGVMLLVVDPSSIDAAVLRFDLGLMNRLTLMFRRSRFGAASVALRGGDSFDAAADERDP